jgi:diguanylate cyclase (GGDEF)-like protein
MRALLTVQGDDLELVREQFKAFAKQIPLLYFVLSVNALAIIYTFARFGHPWISAYLPGAMVAFCIARGLVWWFRGVQDVSPEAALRMMRSTTRLAAVVAAAFSLWGFALYFYGDASAKSEVAFFLALTMIGCTFCLTHLRPAALIVAAIGVAPYSLFFAFADHGHSRVLSVILALVVFGVVATILRNYGDFAALVASRRALMEKHKETLRLADENFRLANQDPLTGLDNRRAFIAKLMALSSATGEPGREVALAFVDLDGFKDVNDDYGHEVGDELIKTLARAFAARAPEPTLLARLGGDEFAAVTAGPDAKARILAFADAVRERLRSPFMVGERTVKVGASIGVATAAPGDCDGHELLRRADVAMYKVKANGKFGVRVYSPDLDAERRRQALLMDEIRVGVARGEFEVFYQPIVDAKSNAIAAVEALLRWPRRPGGPIGPDAFIPAAEAGGLIEALGLFVLRRACEDFAGFDDIAVSVNVSPVQFRDRDFECKVATILAETGFPALRLSLEVTEGYLIDDPQRAAAVIAALRAIGVRVALDDFGAGYTSVNYLQKYGFSAIKIDRSLTSRIAIDEKARVLVTGVVYLANGLDMVVTAEGVETEEQARMLRIAGCQYLQGYYYHRPKSMKDLLAGVLGVRKPASAVA